MSKYNILCRLKDSLWRNLNAGADLAKLKKITILYVYDTPFAAAITKKLADCTDAEKLFDLINDIIEKEVDAECKSIGGLANNRSSVTYQLMHMRPRLVDVFYSYQTEDLPVVLSSMILMVLEPWVGKGISQEYFDNFKNNLYACDSYDKILEFVDATINGGKNYVAAGSNN